MFKYYSFSLISTFKQCQRKFFYQYILSLPTKPSIHFEKGKILHDTVAKFFDTVDPEMNLTDLRFLIKNIVVACWNKKREVLESLDVDDLDFQLEECKMMADNWVVAFYDEFSLEIEKGYSREEAVLRLKPKFEVKVIDHDLKLIGFIDALHEKDGVIEIMDYKTSKKADMDHYKLQLALYSLLFEKQFNKLPHKASFFFFKHGKKALKVDQELIDYAHDELKKIKENTKSRDRGDYPKNVTPLCKWSSGQCDFFEKCFNSDEEYLRERAMNR